MRSERRQGDVAAGDEDASGPGPRGRRPAMTAATPTAPAPSATIPCARARKRIASSISASDTCASAGDVVAHERERRRARLEVAGQAVGERLPDRERGDLPRREGRRERRRARGLDRDDADLLAARRHRPSPEARLPPPSGHATVSVAPQLGLELAPDRRLPRDHARVVVGRTRRSRRRRRPARARAPPPRRSRRRAGSASPGAPAARRPWPAKRVSRTTTVTGTPSAAAAHAMPSPAFPADAVTTGRTHARAPPARRGP